MRGFFIKLALSLSLVAVLTFYPLKTISDMLETDKNYKNILLNMRYLPLELYYNDRRADYAVYRISESEPEKLYDTIFKEVSQMDCFGFMGIINMNPVFVSSIYLNVGEPELEYSEVKIGDITHKNVSVKNGRELKSENGKSISSYTVFDFFAQNDLLEIVSGRMLDCEKDYDRGDTVEVVVTSGIGCSVGDILYISLNAMDESYTQVLIRAEVTGIAEKGVFLPSYPGYDLHSTVEEVYTAVFEKEMIYLPDLSSYYSYNLAPESASVQEGQFRFILSSFHSKQPEGHAGVMQNDTVTAFDIAEELGAKIVPFNTYGLVAGASHDYELSGRKENLKKGICIIFFEVGLYTLETIFIVASIKKLKRQDGQSV